MRSELSAMEAEVSRKSESEHRKRQLDRELDMELESTFPASDALKLTRSTPSDLESSAPVEDRRSKTKKQ